MHYIHLRLDSRIWPSFSDKLVLIWSSKVETPLLMIQLVKLLIKIRQNLGKGLNDAPEKGSILIWQSIVNTNNTVLESISDSNTDNLISHKTISGLIFAWAMTWENLPSGLATKCYRIWKFKNETINVSMGTQMQVIFKFASSPKYKQNRHFYEQKPINVEAKRLYWSFWNLSETFRC